MPDPEPLLRSALKRKEAPANLADGVMARIARETKHRAGWWSRLGLTFRTPQLKWAAAVALALALMAGGIIEHHRAELERARGEAAKAQLMQALRIASTKLNDTWKKALEPERRTPPS
jgi:hypothetical protein